jgi:hypothetical protein
MEKVHLTQFFLFSSEMMTFLFLCIIYLPFTTWWNEDEEGMHATFVHAMILTGLFTT